MEPLLQNTLKRVVAKRVVELVKPGMVIGLGTGSTTSLAIEELGKLIQQGKVEIFHIEMHFLSQYCQFQCVLCLNCCQFPECHILQILAIVNL